MIITQNITENIREAVIYLKNGQRKYGMLIDNERKDAFYFISNSDLNIFRKTNSEKYIEIVSENSIEAIDIDLK